VAEAIIRLTDDGDRGGVNIDIGFTPAIAPDAEGTGLTAAQRLALGIVKTLREHGAASEGYVFRPEGVGDEPLPDPDVLREQAVRPDDN
jgi:hypothetical protein